MKYYSNEKGFTLIEVIASIVLISIVLLSFSLIFIQTNKTAAHNNEKLVTINLADAALAKVRAKSYTKITTPGATLQDYFIDKTTTNKKLMDPPLEIEMNGKTYTVTYKPSQSKVAPSNSNYSEEQLNLIKVVVTVTSPDGKIKGSSEGYVSIE